MQTAQCNGRTCHNFARMIQTWNTKPTTNNRTKTETWTQAPSYSSSKKTCRWSFDWQKHKRQAWQWSDTQRHTRFAPLVSAAVWSGRCGKTCQRGSIWKRQPSLCFICAHTHIRDAYTSAWINPKMHLQCKHIHTSPWVLTFKHVAICRPVVVLTDTGSLYWSSQYTHA